MLYDSMLLPQYIQVQKCIYRYILCIVIFCRAIFAVLCRNPPADHWALVSGLPTYVAENGLVSVLCPPKQSCQSQAEGYHLNVMMEHSK